MQSETYHYSTSLRHQNATTTVYSSSTFNSNLFISSSQYHHFKTLMDHYNPRPLNPHAPPFYPSRFHRPIRRQPPSSATKKDVRCSLTPVSRGPRIRLCGGRKIREVVPLNPDEHCTSVMIRNIPNNYTYDIIFFLSSLFTI